MNHPTASESGTVDVVLCEYHYVHGLGVRPIFFFFPICRRLILLVYVTLIDR